MECARGDFPCVFCIDSFFQESIRGAKKFMAGMGKHGKFNVEPVAEKQDWQVELEEMMKAQEPESQDVDKKP